MILLGISPSLLRIFKSTNPIESMIGGKNRERQRQALAQRRDHPALDRGGSGGGREAVPPRQRLPRPPAVARRAGEDAANRRCPDRHRGLTRPGPQETRLLQWALRRSYCVTRPISAPHRDRELPVQATSSRPRRFCCPLCHWLATDVGSRTCPKTFPVSPAQGRRPMHRLAGRR